MVSTKTPGTVLISYQKVNLAVWQPQFNGYCVVMRLKTLFFLFILEESGPWQGSVLLTPGPCTVKQDLRLSR